MVCLTPVGLCETKLLRTLGSYKVNCYDGLAKVLVRAHGHSRFTKQNVVRQLMETAVQDARRTSYIKPIVE